MEHLDIGTLSARRDLQKLILIYNIFNNKISIGDISDDLSIRVPILRLRNRNQMNFFYIRNSLCAPEGLSSPLISAMIIFNRHSSNLDLAHDFSSFKIIGRDVLELEQSTIIVPTHII
uniref:Uncharacterized protein n=1 Tax=Cacopsylla melanoneura TaxID=428564 RepID=A0A8D8XX20_9HEMI